jgi:hypothetical protein
MKRSRGQTFGRRQLVRRSASTAVFALTVVSASLCVDQNPAKAAAPAPKAKEAKPAAPAAPPAPSKKAIDRMAVLARFRDEMPTHKAAIGKSGVDFTSQELDRMLLSQLGSRAGGVAPLASDERFVRRVHLDATGKLPESGAVTAFVADKDPKKRAKLIETLMNGKDFGRHWARYWRNVILYDTQANPQKISPKVLEDWLADEFEKNVGWDVITAILVSAEGKKMEYGPDNFSLAEEGKPERLAAQTARIFMGINIQCAECHNHPFDKWKREQFHELAAFFASGKYYMPNLHEPEKKTEMQPKFLLGEKPKGALDADEKRVAVAAYLIYNPNNYWFARAFVNRVWHELFGDAFYAVDSLGPDNEVQYKLLVNRLAAVFRYKDFKPKWLFRTLFNSAAYQREIRNPASETDRFASVRPTRLQGLEVAEAVDQVLGPTKVQDQIRRTFAFDPSLPQQDIDGSIQQALLMMNEPNIQRQILQGPLTKRLTALKNDQDVVQQAYLAVLAREPTGKELARSLDYLKKTKPHNEAVEDLVWTLVNSAEFVIKR